jgi:hypothetical protein
MVDPNVAFTAVRASRGKVELREDADVMDAALPPPVRPARMSPPLLTSATMRSARCVASAAIAKRAHSVGG